MENILNILISNAEILMFAAVFLSVALVTLAVMNMTSAWSDVRRRTVASTDVGLAPMGSPGGSILYTRSNLEIFNRLLPSDEQKKSELVKFLNSAGYYGTGALVRFQFSRVVVAIVFGVITAAVYGRVFPNHLPIAAAAATVALTFFGYMLPRTFVSLRRDKLIEEHRHGFPDFLDLLVICVEAGIGVDSAVERISHDLSLSFPSLSRNLAFMSLELRAGKSTREALDNLGSRLSIEEAKSFATLIRQSEELGTSLVQSLRVYSDDMRDKRLARAEEKAHALPVKLVLPLALFIFPVILGVTLMPVAMVLYRALGI